MTNPYKIGDPVCDLAQGRAMVVLEAPEQTVSGWSDENGYDLMENYANEKLNIAADEYVVECVYVSNIQSEPSRTYTFPVSRVVLIDAHHADDGRRIADRVVVDVLERLFGAAIDSDIGATVADVNALAHEAGVGDDVRSLAEELAKADREAPNISTDE